MASDDRLTPEQIAEWRAMAISERRYGTDGYWLDYEYDAQAIAQADAENHLGYFDTRTHVAVQVVAIRHYRVEARDAAMAVNDACRLAEQEPGVVEAQGGTAEKTAKAAAKAA